MVSLKEFLERRSKNPSKKQVISTVHKKTPLDYARESYAQKGHYTTNLFEPYGFCPEQKKKGVCKGSRVRHYHSPDAPHERAFAKGGETI